MWNWFNCYLSGRHDYGVSCAPGTIFLRCLHCGRRSSGWSLDDPHHSPVEAAPAKTASVLKIKIEAVQSGRVLPFSRAIS